MPQVAKTFGGFHEAIVATAFADYWRGPRVRGNRIQPGPFDEYHCALPHRAEYHLRDGEQFRGEAGCLLTNRHAGAAADHDLYPWGRLDRRREGNTSVQPDAVSRYGLERRERRVSIGSGFSGAGGCRGLSLRVAMGVSRLQYGRGGFPPVISIQGDADPVVPYSHSVRLQQALQKAGVDHELVTIPGGKHGNFTRAENQRAYAAIKAFLAKHGLTS